MKEVEIEQLLAYELGDGDLGTEHEFKGFSAQIADKPVGHSLLSLAGKDKDEPVPPFYKRFSIWAVPHRLSIIRRKGLSEPISVGVEVEYQTGGKTCSIVGLFPSFEFCAVGTIGGTFSANADLGGNLTVSESLPEETGQKKLGQLTVGLQTKGNVGLTLQCQIITPKIMAAGIGSSHCEWRFDANGQPLYGRDLETWSLVALGKSQKELAYKMRFYVITRLAFVPQRFQSRWEDVVCQLSS